MWSSELAYKNGLASTRGCRVEQPSPRPLPLAGFALTTVGRFWGDHEAKHKGNILQVPKAIQSIMDDLNPSIDFSLNPNCLSVWTTDAGDSLILTSAMCSLARSSLTRALVNMRTKVP